MIGIESGEEPIIKMRGLHKYFGPIRVIKEINLDVMPSEVVVIIGLSGGRKSTFLRCLNFLEEPSAGNYLNRRRGNQRRGISRSAAQAHSGNPPKSSDDFSRIQPFHPYDCLGQHYRGCCHGQRGGQNGSHHQSGGATGQDGSVSEA